MNANRLKHKSCFLFSVTLNHIFPFSFEALTMMNNSNVVDVQAQLLRASREGNLALVKELVGWQGMDPNSHKKDGRTPLMLASLFGREEVVAFLLCLPSINTEAKNVGGEMTALHYAAARGHLQVVKLLLDHGADLAAVTKRCCTPLIMAVGRGRVVKLLLDYGADPAAVDVRGITALMKAAMNGRGEVAALLLSISNINLEARCGLGMTALHRAVVGGHLNLVKMLLQHGADPTSVDNNGLTILDRAVSEVQNNTGEKRDKVREVLRHLVVEVGLPVTDKMRGVAAGDADSLAISQQGRAEVRSLQKLARRVVWRLPREAQQLLPTTVQDFVNN